NGSVKVRPQGVCAYARPRTQTEHSSKPQPSVCGTTQAAAPRSSTSSTSCYVCECGSVQLGALRSVHGEDPATFPPQNVQGLRGDGAAQAIHAHAVFRHLVVLAGDHLGQDDVIGAIEEVTAIYGHKAPFVARHHPDKRRAV